MSVIKYKNPETGEWEKVGAPSVDTYSKDAVDAMFADRDAELEEVKTSVSEGKALIAAAVTDKGVSTAADATFQTMANNIESIETGIQTASYTGAILTKDSQITFGVNTYYQAKELDEKYANAKFFIYNRSAAVPYMMVLKVGEECVYNDSTSNYGTVYYMKVERRAADGTLCLYAKQVNYPYEKMDSCYVFAFDF